MCRNTGAINSLRQACLGFYLIKSTLKYCVDSLSIPVNSALKCLQKCILGSRLCNNKRHFVISHRNMEENTHSITEIFQPNYYRIQLSE
jgi:hypothetical protein